VDGNRAESKGIIEPGYDGGTYTIGDYNTPPTCSLGESKGHKLN